LVGTLNKGEGKMFKDRKNLQPATKLISIELVSQKLNITAREILFYRKRGLLCALAEGASTFITEKDFVRLKVILAGKRAGFKMIQIEKLMKNRNNTRLNDLENYFILKDCRVQIRELERKKREMTDVIFELENTCSALNEWHQVMPAKSSRPAEQRLKFGF
jgi:DNA-binding transcriptional MerR regulator